ncbi:hypothetical protein [Catenulispora pinistramenti]|uniref:hypothetical protein n=1 Tax=Catenulispora pinistramenti TaxID=2705254 RepID=UPI001E4C7CB7|nr:hypothetical protein [Catenulispora pinistramenti]
MSIATNATASRHAGLLGVDPRRDGRGGAALNLPEQPRPAAQVHKADVPPVGHNLPAVFCLVQPVLRSPAPGLIDPETLRLRRHLREHGCSVLDECSLHDRPGHLMVTRGLKYGPPRVSDRHPS